jgi:hypothetical protein
MTAGDFHTPAIFCRWPVQNLVLFRWREYIKGNEPNEGDMMFFLIIIALKCDYEKGWSTETPRDMF